MVNDYPKKQIVKMAMYICRKEPKPQTWQECKECAFKNHCYELTACSILHKRGYRQINSGVMCISKKKLEEILNKE